jgi:iron(III) transport system ATP-binding protein
VALARALVYHPPLILLDEPLSNLDAKLREEARIWIRELIKKAGLTAIFVTHDQVEAMAIADRIMLLDGGRMVQDGTPEELYTAPQSLFAADFMGINNTFEGRVAEVVDGRARLDLGGFPVWGVNKMGKAAGDKATAVIRIEQIDFAAGESESINHIRADLETSAYLGGRWEHILRLDGQPIRAVTQRPLQPGAYGLSLPKDNLWIF